jgi:DNA-binding PadR family transcriptional regulator
MRLHYEGRWGGREGRCGGREYHGRFRGRHGFMGRFGGFMGPGMRMARMLASGDLQLIILALMSEKPRHGYEIIKAIEEHTSGMYTPSPGVVYPALTYLEEMGYASSEQEGVKKLYRITETGAEHLKKNNENVDEMLEQLARFGRRMAEMRRHYAEQTEEAEDLAGEAGRQIKGEWKKTKAQFREMRDELKAALYEKLDASEEERKRILGILRKTIEEIRAKN